MFVNLVWWSSRLYGGEGKEGAEGGRGSLSVRRREQPGLQIATIRDTNEGNASDIMHAFSGIVGCQCRRGAMSIPVVLLTGQPSSGAQLSDVRGRFRQSRWSEDGLPISGRSLRASPHLDVRPWLKDSLRWRMRRKSDTGTRAVCGVSV